MKHFVSVALVAIVALIAGCGGGSSKPAPGGIKVVAGDTSATVTWNQESGVEYWVWVAQSPNVTTDNCSSTPSCRTFIAVSSPYVVAGLTNGTTYSVTVNARTSGGPGGPGTEPIAFVPRVAGSTWTLGSSLGAVELRGVWFTATTAVSGGTLVAVGAGGAIYWSNNAVTWTAATSGVSVNLNAVQFRNGLFVAVGDGGTILTSPDGVVWTPRSSGTTNNLYALTGNGAGTVVAAGAKGTILGSTNSTDWVSRDSSTAIDLHGVAFGNSRYIAVGDQGTVVSSNGDGTWTTIAPETSKNLTGISYGTAAATATAPALATFVAVGAGGTLLTSADGATWIARTPITTVNLAAVEYGTQFVAVGAGGAIFTSTDGVTWQPQDSGTTNNLNALTFTVLTGGSVGVGYVAVGAGGTNLSAF